MDNTFARVPGLRDETNKRVLIVEDDPDLVALLLETISLETPYEAMFVTNAFMAIQATMHLKPDLIVLDYQLPSMNGLELYDRLEELHALNGIDVIMLSANLPWQELARRKLIGMSKPFDLDAFLDMLRNIFVTQEKNSNETNPGGK